MQSRIPCLRQVYFALVNLSENMAWLSGVCLRYFRDLGRNWSGPIKLLKRSQTSVGFRDKILVYLHTQSSTGVCLDHITWLNDCKMNFWQISISDASFQSDEEEENPALEFCVEGIACCWVFEALKFRKSNCANQTRMLIACRIWVPDVPWYPPFIPSLQSSLNKRK